MNNNQKITISSGKKSLHVLDIHDGQVSIRLEVFNPFSMKVERRGAVLDHEELIGMLEPLLKYRNLTE